jgi:hypothetical protein
VTGGPGVITDVEGIEVHVVGSNLNSWAAHAEKVASDWESSGSNLA